MRLRGTALFIEGVERGLAAAIIPIVVPTNLSSGSPEDREPVPLGLRVAVGEET